MERTDKSEGNSVVASVDGSTGGVLVVVLPEELQFGTLCVGFTYQLTITLLNKAARPQRFKVQCRTKKFSRTKNSEEDHYSLTHQVKSIRPIFDSTPVASGLSTTVILELKADHVGNPEFELTVWQSLSSVIVSKNITARIVSLEAFRCMTQALANKENLYAPGVRPVPAVEKPQGMSPRDPTPVITSPEMTSGKPITSLPSAASLITESLLTEEDIEDLVSIPMLYNQYWDPIEQKLVNDHALSKVIKILRDGVCASYSLLLFRGGTGYCK
jgi:hypothetical protein